MLNRIWTDFTVHCNFLLLVVKNLDDIISDIRDIHIVMGKDEKWYFFVSPAKLCPASVGPVVTLSW